MSERCTLQEMTGHLIAAQSDDVKDYVCGLAAAYQYACKRGARAWEPEEVEE
jgi:hypothetical protein